MTVACMTMNPAIPHPGNPSQYLPIIILSKHKRIPNCQIIAFKLLCSAPAQNSMDIAAPVQLLHNGPRPRQRSDELRRLRPLSSLLSTRWGISELDSLNSPQTRSVPFIGHFYFAAWKRNDCLCITMRETMLW
ncbi:hypothetical protein CDAR_277371 [Caerostris darwini]|uniref:Uncharacterized protein n=1 Tax=Caerostris darwini TaxID=1538125 RepID=A0AAV4VRG3_9ARAC|nr:hypothetical protein CDAR_277371 [Caerostris darwini]